MRADLIVPSPADLPGVGWVAIGDGFGAEGEAGPGALLDCVGPDFPDASVVESASSPHFLRPPATLVHGTGVRFETEAAAEAAHAILSGPEFAACLGRSVAADLEAGDTTAELLGIDRVATMHGHRVRFTGGDGRGVRPVNLDIATVRVGTTVGVLWCGDTPDAFPADDLGQILGRIRDRGRP
ncbi:hypothetical protein [Actinospongicola halichondriae]|uniref:hypothetical protein n=1 Tax=Actinospongicola halichondriae TaxID=3236844 RepID=UPI003D496830